MVSVDYKKKTTLNTQNTPPVPPSRMNLPTPKPYSFGDGGSFNFRPCCWVSLGYQLWLMITWRRPKVYQNVSQKTHRVMALWMSHIAAVPKTLPRFWTVDMIDASNFRKTMGIYQLSLAVWHEIDLLNIFVFFWLSSPWETLRPTLPPTSQHLCWRKGDKSVTT